MQIRPPVSVSSEMLVVFNDTQLKRQCDEEALGAALSFVKEHKKQITHFIFNGDILDFEEQSDYSKYPDMRGQSEKEIKSGQWLISYISELLPNAERVFIMGNHDARWSNMIKNQTMGFESWVVPFDEMFLLTQQEWQVIEYGKGNYYRWHDRIFWHGHRSGSKSNIPRLELDDAGVSVTTAHINRNMFHEYIDAFGNYKSAVTHGGFSKDNLEFIKKANTGWMQGFGVYFWHKSIGEQVFPIIMRHGTPKFMWGGKMYDGKGFKLPK